MVLSGALLITALDRAEKKAWGSETRQPLTQSITWSSQKVVDLKHVILGTKEDRILFLVINDSIAFIWTRPLYPYIYLYFISLYPDTSGFVTPISGQ